MSKPLVSLVPDQESIPSPTEPAGPVLLVTEAPTAASSPAPRKAHGQKVTALVIALLFHLLLLVAFLHFVISIPQPNPPDIIATVQPLDQDETLDQQQFEKVVRTTPTPPPSQSIDVVSVQGMSSVPLPTMDFDAPTISPFGMGDTFGASMAFDAPSSEGGMVSFFGSAMMRGGLQGKLFDFKQRPDQSPSGENVWDPPGYKAALRRLVSLKFKAERFEEVYYRAPTTLQFGFLAVPILSADEGPKAFRAERYIAPRAWLIHYSGEVSPPVSGGRWKFVGGFDDALVVFINGRLVFDGSWNDFMDEPDCRIPFGKQKLEGHTWLWEGKWTTIPKRARMDVLVGERPGGHIGGILLVQHSAEGYESRGDGTPILPLFTLTEIEGANKQRIDSFPYELDPNPPIFLTH